MKLQNRYQCKIKKVKLLSKFKILRIDYLVSNCTVTCFEASYSDKITCNCNMSDYRAQNRDLWHDFA